MKTKIVSFLFLALITATVQADSLGTAFTYQGRLNASGVPANGSYDFIFTLYTNSATGNQIGLFPTNGLPVTNGLFTVSMDFGNLFDGTAYWLGISVRTNGGGSYSLLNPRQPITPTPYTLFANTASNLSGTASAAVNFSGSLSGDVTGTQGATVVSTVGGQTAANVANGISVVNTATAANNADAIVKRDGGGNFSAGSVALSGNLNLPTTTASAGVIYSGADRFIHAYGVRSLFAGVDAGNFTTTGTDNVGIGFDVLGVNTSGQQNIGIGSQALSAITSGNNNTAVGFNALGSFTSGRNNIAVGRTAGLSITTGDNNIFIGNTGSDGDSGVIRIGTSGTHQSASIAGIYNHAADSGVPVYVVASGQLGTIPSSAKFKEDIQNMCDVSDILYALKPVTFRYKLEIDPKGTRQFGLVAEEVDKVAPDLVVRDEEHGVYSVRYQAVDVMLLNEFLKQHRKVEAQSVEIQELKQSVAELKKLVQFLTEKK